MTIYEHAMFGGTLALAAGALRRHGWGLVGVAAVAAALPDWDGLSLLFGPAAYAEGHRVWGHNLLAAGLLGAAVGAVGYLIYRSKRLRGPTGAREAVPNRFKWQEQAVWAVTGMCAGWSHLPADIVFNGGKGLSPWPVPVLWPFASKSWAYPLVAWGDVTITLIFVVEMFALYRWVAHARAIAALTLTAGSAYLLIRWLFVNFTG